MSRNRVLYGIIVLFMLLFLAYSMSRVAVMSLIALVVLPPVSYVLSLVSLRRLVISVKLEEKVIIKEEETKYLMTIKNRSFLPISGINYVFLSNKAVTMELSKEGKNLILNPGEKITVAYALRGRFRGYWEIGVSRVEMPDFLGLFKLKRNVREKAILEVHPRIVKLEDFPIFRSLMTQEQARQDLAMEDYEEISDIRQYRASDPIKKIHWKLSARFQDWIVKNYQTTAWDATAIILDRKAVGVETEDFIIETSVALGYEILQQQRPVSLVYGENNRLDAFFMQDFTNYYMLLAQMSFLEGDVDAFPSSFLEEHLQGQSINIVVITSELSETIASRMMRANDFGHHVVLAYVCPARETWESRNIFESIERAGIAYVRFDAR